MSQRSLHLPWLDKNAPIRVAVVGDVILDEYLEGQVNRISPEAPVPVHLVDKSTQTAGGAANVARNIKLAGGDVILCGVWGHDETAVQLRKILDDDGISCEAILTDHERPTVKKTRISANNQQIVRIDWERIHCIKSSFQEAILNHLQGQAFDALLISDYGKGTLPVGFLADLLALAYERNIPSLVDPKGKDFNRYMHASVIKPNRKEACEALSLDPTEHWSGDKLGKHLQATFGLQGVLLTLGPQGMVYIPPEQEKDQSVVTIPAEKREVFDVSGAGDTVIALLALGLGSGMSMSQAMTIANVGAGIVVGKWGTQPIDVKDLYQALEKQKNTHAEGFDSTAKILDIDKAYEIRLGLKQQKKNLVFTNGCFDILHAGHVQYLEAARSKGDVLIVGINGDQSIQRIKGELRPIIPESDRAQVLAALACVDYVVIFKQDTPEDLINRLIPDVLVKGADWQIDDIIGGQTVLSHGGQVLTIPLKPGRSTTNVIERVLSSHQ